MLDDLFAQVSLLPAMLSFLMQWVGWFFMSVGVFFIVTGAIGLLRLPDIYSRLHAAGLTDTLGAALLLLGLICHAGLSISAIKLALIFLFILISGPTATHALAHAAWVSKIKPKTSSAK